MAQPFTTKDELDIIRPWLASEPDLDEGGETAGWCPLHEDEAPSASYNLFDGVMYCFAGCGGFPVGKLAEWISEGDPKIHKPDADLVDLESERMRRRGRAAKAPKRITWSMVEGWHARLQDNPSRFGYLVADRALDPETIEKYRIGWDGRRYTIPIASHFPPQGEEGGEIYNVRRYLPEAKGPDKMRNMRGHGSPARLYPMENLDASDRVIITEGELDALVATQYRFPALTGTGGADVWRSEWNELFTGKKVYICYDRDKAGEAGARNVADALLPYASAVYIVRIPMEEKGADITDLFLREGYSTDGFEELLQGTKRYQRRDTPDPSQEEERYSVSVTESFNPEYSGDPIEMVATIVGKRNPPFYVPKTINFSCGIDQGDKCAVCPLRKEEGDLDLEMPNSREILELVDTADTKKRKVLQRVAGITGSCNAWDYLVEEEQAVEELQVTDSIDDDPEEVSHEPRRVYNVGRYDTHSNLTARIVGTTYSSPKNQRAEFMSWEAEPTESNIDTFRTTGDIATLMERFQPDHGQRPIAKMAEIAEDLSANVTHIHQRPDLHIAYDLVAHSVLGFKLRGETVRKGWMDALIVGDTRTGKSEVAERLSKHYGGGRIVSCESATLAGILGAVKQFGGSNAWVLTWGAVPLNDRRMVVLDEVSGLVTKGEGAISQLSSLRSSGIAEITKVEQSKTMARTRLLWISNPLSGKSIGDYSHGTDAIVELIGNYEDVARFDFAMTLVPLPIDVIHHRENQGVTHRYTEDACHALLMWAWSRSPDDVIFTKETEESVLDLAEDLAERYVEVPPLIQAANARVKIARIAASIAARTFSTDDTFQKVIVKPQHATDAVWFLDRIYGRESMGYLDLSKRVLRDKEQARRSKRATKEYLQGRKELVDFLLRNDRFTRDELVVWLNTYDEDAKAIIHHLMRKGMLTQHRGVVQVLPLMNRILRELEERGK